MCTVDECDSLIFLLTLRCHFIKHTSHLLYSFPQPVTHQMTLINRVSPLLSFLSLSFGVLLWLKTLNIQLSIISIFKSFKAIALDKSIIMCALTGRFIQWDEGESKTEWILPSFLLPNSFILLCLFVIRSPSFKTSKKIVYL